MERQQPLRARALDTQAADHPSGAPRGQDEPALRDARAVAERIAGDEQAADAARERYRAEGLPRLEPGGLATLLEPGEWLHAIHRLAVVEARAMEPTGVPSHLEEPRGGVLYLTSRQLIHGGAGGRAWPLAEIREMGVSLERLLLVELRDGSDLTIEVDQPRLLRVQLAAAIAAQRSAGAPRESAGASG